jgi:hypothetical protein
VNRLLGLYADLTTGFDAEDQLEYTFCCSESSSVAQW